MNTSLPENTSSAELSLSIEDTDYIDINLTNDDLPDRNAKARRYNSKARRQIEEHLENRRLALLTKDYFFDD